MKLYERQEELYVLARSDGRQAKEIAIRRKRLVRLLRKPRAMRRSLPSRDQLLLRLGAARKEAGRAFGFVTITLPGATEKVTRSSFHFRVDKLKLRQAEQRDGHYLLRSNLTAEDPAVLWTRYIQLTNIESAFRTLKSDLGLRPIHHRLDRRVEAHIFVAFLAYCLQVTQKNQLQIQAPGLTPRAVLEKLPSVQMIDVWIPTRDNRWLVMPRYPNPSQEVQILLEKLGMELPAQPPPRIKAQESSAPDTPRPPARLQFNDNSAPSLW